MNGRSVFRGGTLAALALLERLELLREPLYPRLKVSDRRAW